MGLWSSTWLITPQISSGPWSFIQVSPCAVQQTSFILHVLVSSMERWISIQSRGHSDYRLTGDLHAPLQRAEHVFILFFPPRSLSFYGPEQLIQGFLIEQNTGEMRRGALIMNGWHWWWEEEKQNRKRELWLKELCRELASTEMWSIYVWHVVNRTSVYCVL